MMSALMSDVLLGRVSPQTASAAINAGGKLLKAAELQLKYSESKRMKNAMPLIDSKVK